MPREIRDRVFITSVEVIEFSHLLEKNENTAKWAWFFRTYLQWQSVAFALSEVCNRPPGPDVERAWRAIESVYNDQMIKNLKTQKGMLWKPLRHLMAKAKIRRAAQQAQAAKQASGQSDVLSREGDNSAPTRGLMQDYADPSGGNPFEDLGVVEQPYAAGMSMQATMPAVTQVSGNEFFPEDGLIGGNWTPEQMPMPSNNEILKFGWSPSLGDSRQEGFERFFMNLQEEWF